MRPTLGVLAAVAVISGIVSAFAFSELTDHASAAPPLQSRESVLPVIAGKFVEVGGPSTGAWVDVRDSDAVFRVALDASKYPAGTSFRLELAGSHVTTDPVGTGCVRLAEIVGESRISVTGSDVCSSTGGPLFASGSSFTLPTGSHLYTIQAQSTAQGGILRLTAARIIVEWMERTR